LEIKPRRPIGRLFGSIGAWLNNDLLRGKSQRVNCEWITDNKQYYIVQVDEEDEDFLGLNPYQIRTEPAHTPNAANGSILQPARGAVLKEWDKLIVLDQLWEPHAAHQPTLFYVPLSELAARGKGLEQSLETDFRSLIGPDNIVVRTSIRAGVGKQLNLPRTECVNPKAAARWCGARLADLQKDGQDPNDYCFVAHRFIDSRASAWVRAEPGNPIVEIHCLWGLPDALQYCPYDIWEVHVPTETVTDYPEYKSDILVPKKAGGWGFVRVKNELARNLSVGRADALDLANRTAAIADRIGEPCHVMWFIGCIDDQGDRFSIPWYWAQAAEPDRNVDRSNYKVITIRNYADLESFKTAQGPKWRQALELKPTADLVRDNKFLELIGVTAHELGVPVIIEGSTLAHAYYQLRKHCTVIARGEKGHSRVRQSASFGKLVRDKIPGRIAQRKEADITRRVPNELLKGFLTSKLLEEALEVRTAASPDQKTTELADLYEVFRALVNAEGFSIEEVVAKSDEKRSKAGGFREGYVLLQTGILGRGRAALADIDKAVAQVLARKRSAGSYDIPFSFFGFMELDQPRFLKFEELGVTLSVTLKSDRIELQLTRGSQQYELPLDLSVDAEEESLDRSSKG
jgi:predicted house-cleaning noncanonical NTP pyrophosphatase (MazG superfamily)